MNSYRTHGSWHKLTFCAVAFVLVAATSGLADDPVAESAPTAPPLDGSTDVGPFSAIDAAPKSDASAADPIDSEATDESKFHQIELQIHLHGGGVTTGNRAIDQLLSVVDWLANACSAEQPHGAQAAGLSERFDFSAPNCAGSCARSGCAPVVEWHPIESEMSAANKKPDWQESNIDPSVFDPPTIETRPSFVPDWVASDDSIDSSSAVAESDADIIPGEPAEYLLKALEGIAGNPYALLPESSATDDSTNNPLYPTARQTFIRTLRSLIAERERTKRLQPGKVQIVNSSQTDLPLLGGVERRIMAEDDAATDNSAFEALRRAGRALDEAANELELSGLYDEADRLHAQASELRQRSHQIARRR